MQNPNNIQDSFFILLAAESIKYILNKNIDKKIKKTQIEELGIQLGEKESNHIMNDKNFKFDDYDNKYSKIIKSMASIQDIIWINIFRMDNFQLKTDANKSIFYIYTGDIKLYNFLYTEKGMNQKNEVLEAILWFIGGIIKGTANVFNIECITNGKVRKWEETDYQEGENKIKIKQSQFFFEFIINILNNEDN